MWTKFKRRTTLAAKAFFSGSACQPVPREIPAITPDEIAEVKQFFPLEKFFIFGHARSGTTLLVRLVRLHPKVHCNYQAHFFTRQPLLQSMVASSEVGEWLSRKSNRWNRGKDLSPVVLRAIADFIMEREARHENKVAPGCLVGDKSPNSLMDGQSVHLLHKVYPDARLFYIMRDGRDTIISHRFQAFIDTPEHLSKEDLRIREAYSKDPQPFLSGQRSLFTEKGLCKAAEGWVRNVIETDQAAQEFYNGGYHHLRYEDLLQDPYKEICGVWAFLGLDAGVSGLIELVGNEISQNPDTEWQIQQTGSTAVTEKGKQGTWRQILTLHDRKLFSEIAGETLTAWGYEP